MDQNKLERTLRLSGILVLAGLGVELATLFWSHPTAFLLFVFLGGLLMVLGVVIYLLALVRAGQPTKSDIILEAQNSDLVSRAP